MLKKIAIAVALILVVFVAAVAMQPAQFEVTRKARIAAPPDKVFALVNDFQNWRSWSPWEKLDPAMKKTFSTPASGAGASYSWAGNSDVGEGRMTITESHPNRHIRIKLEFLKPFQSTSMTDFRFTPAENQVEVEWRMTGENSFIEKAFCLVMGGMDKMVGPDFEKGLAQLNQSATQ
jgi:uncharacterized protein YndB with AHSA1/START domain